MAISEKRENGSGRVWIDKKGNEVPYYYVSDEDKKRDKAVRETMQTVRKLREEIKEKKKEIVDTIDGYLADVASQYDEDWKGNATLRDFSDIEKIEVKVSEKIEFDEKLQIAKSKIDECINDWAKSTSQRIRAILNDVFQVDQKGKLNKRKLLQLKKHQFDDPRWKEAMEIIHESIQVVNTKKYYRFFEKEDGDQDAEYTPLSLNFSRVDVRGGSDE